MMIRVKRLLAGGSAGNQQLTAVVAVSVVAVTVVARAFFATATLPAADRLQDRVSAHMGLDAA